MCGELQNGVIDEWECIVDRCEHLPCASEGDGKHGRDDGPYGAFQRNDVMVCKALQESYHARWRMIPSALIPTRALI